MEAPCPNLLSSSALLNSQPACWDQEAYGAPGQSLYTGDPYSLTASLSVHATCNDSPVAPRYKFFFVVCVDQDGAAACEGRALVCPSSADLTTSWWGSLANTVHESPVTSETQYTAPLNATAVDGRTVHVIVHVFEPAGSALGEASHHICLSRTLTDSSPPQLTKGDSVSCTSCPTRAYSFPLGPRSAGGAFFRETYYSASSSSLLLSLPPFDDASAPVQHQGITLLTVDPAFPVSVGATCANLINVAKAGGTLELGDLNMITQLSSGTSAWNTSPGGTTTTPLGYPDPPIGGWLGALAVNPLLASSEQSEQPMPTCSTGEQSYSAAFSLTQLQAACHRTELRYTMLNAELVRVSLNGHSLLGDATNTERLNGGVLRVRADEGLLLEGSNVLTVAIRAVSAGACGVLIGGEVSRFSFYASSDRVAPERAVALMSFDPLPGGSAVVATVAATNRAGRAAHSVAGSVFILDDTPPSRPAVYSCTSGGLLDSDGDFYQSSEEGLSLCWGEPGWIDGESGIGYFEWQLARWVEGSGWDTLVATQAVSLDDSTAALAAGMFTLSADALATLLGFRAPTHPNRYRFAVP